MIFLCQKFEKASFFVLKFDGNLLFGLFKCLTDLHIVEQIGVKALCEIDRSLIKNMLGLFDTDDMSCTTLPKDSSDKLRLTCCYKDNFHIHFCKFLCH